MRQRSCFAISLLVLFATFRLKAAPDAEKQDWANYVRIGAYGLRGGDAAEIVRRRRLAMSSGLKLTMIFPGATRAFCSQKGN